MAVVAAALGLLVRRVWPILSSPVPLPDSDPVPDLEPGTGRATPWELYLGGMAGLILGFVLSFSASDTPLPADTDVMERFFTALWLFRGRLLACVLWFPAAAMFLGVRWTGRSRALVAGVAV